MEDTDYIINKKSKLSYEVHKFLCGKKLETYTIAKGKCSCLSGRYRGYCKHKDWVSKLSKRQVLPEHVVESIQIK